MGQLWCCSSHDNKHDLWKKCPQGNLLAVANGSKHIAQASFNASISCRVAFGNFKSISRFVLIYEVNDVYLINNFDPTVYINANKIVSIGENL